MKLIAGVLMNKYQHMKKSALFLMLLVIFIFSCKQNVEKEEAIDASVPVTITTIDTSPIASYADLNGTATYVVKTIIKSNATGYLNKVNVASNDYVTTGKVLFSLKTRESKVLGNTINDIDPSLNFGGDIKVKATSTGFINMINVQQGDYVQDGDQLAIINDTSSFAIVLSLPYELKQYVSLGEKLDVILPDGKMIKGTVQKFMPTVDMASQTQSVALKIDTKQDIPENLIVKVRITKSASQNAISLPKAAVLSDETEKEFWIMKMIDTHSAIKVPIKKGIEMGDKVEILSPVLTTQDKILLTGNYGVADTIKVKILKN
jgi:multidrug efflux pump subunit AcrA (membrane-fusion protein)